MKQAKWFLLLHVILGIYAGSSVCSKLAAQQPFLSAAFIVLYGLMLLALSASFLPLMLAMFLLGFGISTSNISTNIILQQDAPEALRGRVVSIYTSTRFGFDALGGLCAGLLASLIAPQNVMLLFALILLGYALFNWLRIQKVQ